MKVIIGSRVPPRTSMFEQRDGLGGYGYAMPPITGDAATLQAALLAKPKPDGWLDRLVKALA
jgi:hypothetical protein